MNEKMHEILKITKEFNLDGNDPTLKEIPEELHQLLIAMRKIYKLLTN